MISSGEKFSGVLITTGKYLGTLAAIRDFGRNGIKVTLADSGRSLSHFSRYLYKYETCPHHNTDTDAYIQWLLDYGKANPGLFLYPSCDHTSWLYALHKKKLSRYFTLYSPDRSVLFEILNKKRLMKNCAALGISCPKSIYPTSLCDVSSALNHINMPCLIKPQTQVGSKTKSKGLKVSDQKMLVASYSHQRKNNQYESYIKDFGSGIDWPIIQEYYKEAMQDTLSIAGFISQNHSEFHWRASKKVMQTPRKIGVGLCFESINPPHWVIEQCQKLCQYLGYYGVFEIEFIRRGDQYLLIDFNPRYYGQMEFEIRRSLSAPMLLLEHARLIPTRNDVVSIRKRVYASNEGDYRYSTNWLFYLTLFCSWLGLNLSSSELKKWFHWKNRAYKYFDAVFCRDDIKPFIYHLVTSIAKYVRHPRMAFRNLFLETN